MVINRQRKIDMDKPVTQEQIIQIDKLVAPEFAKGKWETVESEQVFGDQLLDEVIKDPTINIYLDRSPKLNNPIDYEEMVKRLQRQRAIFITAEQKRKEPKTEGED